MIHSKAGAGLAVASTARSGACMAEKFETEPLERLQLVVLRFPAPPTNAVGCLVAYRLTKRRLHPTNLF